MSKEQKFMKCKKCGEFVLENSKMCPHCNSPLKKKLSKGMIAIICVCSFFVVALIIGVFGDDTSSSTDNNSKDSTYTYSQNTLENNNTISSEEKSNENVSMGKKMALESAKSYLRTMGFSKQGLIEQLEFEGYTNDEAIYAVNNCGANWKEQAVRKAKSYLNTMSFSKQGLIEQLEFEGFTNEEAVYGAEEAYK